MVDSFNESSWRRGWNNTKTRWASWVFVIINVGLSIALFLIGLFLLSWYWGVGLAIFSVFCVWVYETIATPYEQRNEARDQLNVLQEGKEKLKGKFFHDFDEEGYVKHQGHIIDLVNEDVVIIQYFDWVLGQPSATKMFKFQDIIDGGWALYSSDEEMRYAYKYGHVKVRIK